MSPKKKNKLMKDIVDFFYSLSLVIAFWVWEETGSIFLTASTFGASLGILYFAIQKHKQYKRKILLESSIDVVDNMSGVMFEQYIFEHFRRLGYTGYILSKNSSSGADMILDKGGVNVVVQVKRWKNSVGGDAIQQVIEAMKHYDAKTGIVVTNSTFTESACEMAKEAGIELWDRSKLMELMCKSRTQVTTAHEIAVTKD